MPFEVCLAWKCLSLCGQEPDVGALGESFREVGEDVRKKLAVPALRADETREQDEVVVAILRGHE
jgi:hypothetical protein